MIEFIYNMAEDKVVMGIECDKNVMDEKTANDVAKSAADELRSYVVTI